MESKCICNVIFEETKKCKVCDKSCDIILTFEEIRNNKCPEHKITFIHGKPFYICEECKKNGWINTK